MLTKTGSGSPAVPPGPGTPPPACCNSSCESMKETGILPSHTSLLCSVSPLMLKRRRGGERERERTETAYYRQQADIEGGVATPNTFAAPPITSRDLLSDPRVKKRQLLRRRRIAKIPLSPSIVMVSYF